jgi:DNA relaxase NicK
MQITYFCPICKENHKDNALRVRWDQLNATPVIYSIVHRHRQQDRKILSVLFLDQDGNVSKVFSDYQTELAKYPPLRAIIDLDEKAETIKSEIHDTMQDIEMEMVALSKTK